MRNIHINYSEIAFNRPVDVRLGHVSLARNVSCIATVTGDQGSTYQPGVVQFQAIGSWIGVAESFRRIVENHEKWSVLMIYGTIAYSVY